MAAAPPPAAPARAQTNITLIPGLVGPPRVPALFQLAHDSPVVTAWPFVPWNIAAPHATAPRSAVVGAILSGTRRPTAVDAVALRAMDFLGHEMTAVHVPS